MYLGNPESTILDNQLEARFLEINQNPKNQESRESKKYNYGFWFVCLEIRTKSI